MLTFEEQVAAQQAENLAWRERERERRMANSALGRHKMYVRKFGVSDLAARSLLAASYGPCEVCLDLPPEGKRHCVDHCHRTGAVRGVLCGRCNTLVGQLENNGALLESARAYLRRPREAS